MLTGPITEIARRSLHVEQLVTHRLALVDAGKGSWSRPFRRLPKDGVPSTAFAEFPLILPEPDSGIRKVLEQALQREGILEKWNVVLEVGSWSTNLAYVRDGYGVGRVSDSALFNSQDLVVRYLDESLFPPIAANLICRRLPGRKEELDLSDEARALRDVLIQGAASSRS